MRTIPWIVALLLATGADAQCVGGVCPTSPPTSGWQSAPIEKPHPAVCRITVRGAGAASLGSGTLIASSSAGGLVLTCSHLFDNDRGAIEATFPNLPPQTAKLLAIDRAEDLAVLTIANPSTWPIELADGLRPVGALTAAGYGSNGAYRSITGPILGTATPQGARYPSLQIRGAVRPGDSGGPVLDPQGKLVAVVWGAREGSTYAAYGAPLKRIVEYALDKTRAGRGLPTPGAAEQTPASSIKAPASPAAVVDSNESRLERVPDAPGPGTARLANDVAINARLESIESQLDEPRGCDCPAGAPLWIAAAGVSGPVGLALSAAWLLLGRRRGAQQTQSAPRPIAIDSPPPPQRTTHETHYVPIERDAFARAHQWASEQVARKFPGAVDVLTTLDSLIKQQMNGGEK
ncbi:hypothetical protein Pla175_03080 [Pirellulimonas nuda]|uniref:Uncharacterized protein n=1 Tax=Pirellulimonas nuda TaxID=2528009 RepID=A0A518D655_9BACT|nr:serine protease [Pirellulimonas nuda]QDU86954.1 hypothetical protein Pla175_03080 [Pirellulimonas nuda]